MIKTIDIAKKISKKLDADHSELLEDINIHKAFSSLEDKGYTRRVVNTIISYIIFAYDNDSPWLNLKQDRFTNKWKILKSLEVDESSKMFRSIVDNDHDDTNEAINEYLIEQTTWKWKHIITLIDYHNNMIRFANKKTEAEKTFDKLDKEGNKETLSEEYDIDKISKVNQQKGTLLEQALKARREADNLLREIKAEYVQVDSAVNADFGFEMTDEKKLDIYSWKQYIQHRNKLKAISQK